MISVRTSLQGRLVCPVAAAPIDNGVVEIADGKIVAVHDRPGPETVDLGEVAILPGLVNAHTHLEFSNLEAPLGPQMPFAEWIGAVVAERRRRQRTDEGGDRTTEAAARAERDPIAKGLLECFATGSSVVGDITTGDISNADDSSFALSAIRAGRLTPYWELLCARSGPGELECMHRGERFLEELHHSAPEGTGGLSPHTPFTVTRALLQTAVQYAARERLPVAMHLAETREELELLAFGRGPLVEMLGRVGLWDAGTFRAGRRPLEYLQALRAAPRVLVIHGNYLEEDELAFLGQHPHMSLVYCPRTHRYFRHSRYPLESALVHRVRVALGTDSRASNPDLNLWEEAKTVAEGFPEIAAERILEMATRNGAEALGVSQHHGILAPGRPADLCCVKLDASHKDPLRAMLGPQSRVVAAMHGGTWIGRQ